MPASASAKPPPPSEAERVVEWRRECLKQAGIRNSAAMVLAATKADLHRMITMHEQGCPTNLLLRIFKEESAC